MDVHVHVLNVHLNLTAYKHVYHHAHDGPDSNAYEDANSDLILELGL